MSETEARHSADNDATRRRLDGHRWLGGYYCECGHGLNSPNGYLDHLAAVLTSVTSPAVTAASRPADADTREP